MIIKRELACVCVPLRAQRCTQELECDCDGLTCEAQRTLPEQHWAGMLAYKYNYITYNKSKSIHSVIVVVATGFTHRKLT